jgi:fructose-bisphosphate aldolase, class II
VKARDDVAIVTIAATQICKPRFEAFGTAGRAGKFKPIALDTMADKYARSEIRAVAR